MKNSYNIDDAHMIKNEEEFIVGKNPVLVQPGETFQIRSSIQKIIQDIGSNKLYAIHFHNAIARKGYQIMFYIIKIGNEYFIGGNNKGEGRIINFEEEIIYSNPSLPTSIINDIDASPEGLAYLIMEANIETN